MTRKSSDPACRVCGCTEHNACDEGCSWARVAKGEAPLCSACSGGAGDMTEAVKRGVKLLDGPGLPRRKIDYAVAIGRAAVRRRNARVKSEANIIDASWGSRR